MAVCEIISVGTEILLGDIVNTDAQFLAVELAKMGISVLYQTTVGDNPKRLRQALKIASSRSDIIIASGGLGPTPDDLTKEVCCEFFDKECSLDKKSLDKMESYFASKGLNMPESNKKQALLPVDGVIFPNDNGTAPGCAIEKDSKHILMLPGPPREIKPMFLNYAVPYLSQFSDKIILSHNVRTFGIGESDMAQRVADLLESENPTVAPYAKEGEALLRVTAMAKNKEEANGLIKPMIDEIAKRLQGFVYGIDEPNIETAVIRMLKEKGLTVATAESCTGGLISKRITDISGSSAVYGCGVISYSNETKENVLGVSHENLEKYGAVSEQVARQMATGVLELSGADIAVSVTGVAGPNNDGTDKPVGLIYLSLAAKDGTLYTKKLLTGKSGPGCREYNRLVAASNAFNLIRLYLENNLE